MDHAPTPLQRLNTAQALALLGWSHRNTLFRYVRKGLIPRYKDSPKSRSRNYYLRHELENSINSGRAANDNRRTNDG